MTGSGMGNGRKLSSRRRLLGESAATVIIHIVLWVAYGAPMWRGKTGQMHHSVQSTHGSSSSAPVQPTRASTDPRDASCVADNAGAAAHLRAAAPGTAERPTETVAGLVPVPEPLLGVSFEFATRPPSASVPMIGPVTASFG